MTNIKSRKLLYSRKVNSIKPFLKLLEIIWKRSNLPMMIIYLQAERATVTYRVRLLASW
jgi:hypothetical protein